MGVLPVCRDFQVFTTVFCHSTSLLPHLIITSRCCPSVPGDSPSQGINITLLILSGHLNIQCWVDLTSMLSTTCGSTLESLLSTSTSPLLPLLITSGCSFSVPGDSPSRSIDITLLILSRSGHLNIQCWVDLTSMLSTTCGSTLESLLSTSTSLLLPLLITSGCSFSVPGVSPSQSIDITLPILSRSRHWCLHSSTQSRYEPNEVVRTL